MERGCVRGVASGGQGRGEAGAHWVLHGPRRYPLTYELPTLGLSFPICTMMVPTKWSLAGVQFSGVESWTCGFMWMDHTGCDHGSLSVTHTPATPAHPPSHISEWCSSSNRHMVSPGQPQPSLTQPEGTLPTCSQAGGPAREGTCRLAPQVLAEASRHAGQSRPIDTSHHPSAGGLVCVCKLLPAF